MVLTSQGIPRHNRISNTLLPTVCDTAMSPSPGREREREKKKTICVYAETLVYLSGISFISRGSWNQSASFSLPSSFFFFSPFLSSKQRLSSVLIGCIFYVMVLIYFIPCHRKNSQSEYKRAAILKYTINTQLSHRALRAFFPTRLWWKLLVTWKCPPKHERDNVFKK